jgi:hypothetical protein
MDMGREEENGLSQKKMAREVEEETTAGHRSAIIRYIILILSTSAGVLVYYVIFH